MAKRYSEHDAKVIVRRLRITGTTIWTCQNCGNKAVGDSVRLDLMTETHFEDISDMLKGHEVSRNLMPIGWASCGADGVKCPKCI